MGGQVCGTSQGICVSIALLLNRLSLGGYFLAAGIGKITSEGGIKGFVEGMFSKLTPDWLPQALATPYGYSLPVAEVVLGGLLMIGLLTRISALLIALMILSFTIALVIANDSLSGGGPNVFHSNVILVTLGLLLFRIGPGRISIDALCPFGKKCKTSDTDAQPS